MSPRKSASGPIRNTERTKQRLLDAVGRIVRKKGVNHLKVNTIELESGIDKKLIYFHFGNIRGLIEEYLKVNDFWTSSPFGDIAELDRDGVVKILTDQFNTIFREKTLQQLLIWELSDINEPLRKISNDRERIGNAMLNVLEEKYGTGGDIRAVTALLVSGIYYIILHAASNGSTFCGLDINDEQDRDRILQAVSRIIHSTV